MGGLLNIVVFAGASLLAVISIWGIIPLGLAYYFIFAGAGTRAEKASHQLSSTLMPDEYIEAEAVQSRVFGLWNRRAIVGMTSSRVIIVQRGIFGGFRMTDIQWKDLQDAKIEQNVLPALCGSNLLFRHLNASAGRVAINGVDSDTAAVIYSKSQAHEQAWEEKRRVRRMEEVRAAAGGVVVHTGQGSPGPVTEAPKGNRMLDEITKAKALLDAGAVSDAEFQEMKAKILAAA